MRTLKSTFVEYCPICWAEMKRQGQINGKAFYICPMCGMATDGRCADAGHGKHLYGNKHPV